jgi:ubiquinone/menaquinone biosynthesis C-methylase UbiE
MFSEAVKPYRGVSMEGSLATWYAKITRRDIAEFRRLAQEITRELPPASRILEVAPGPGYLSVELAKSSAYKVTGLDISQSFVRMASDYARLQGTRARFIHGSASDIPLEDEFFDLIICRAAFKNFSAPLEALNEMHRVLKPGGQAIIIDLRKDASWNEIVDYVDQLKLGRMNAWITRMTFKHMLLRRAYCVEDFRRLASNSSFKSCRINESSTGMEIRLTRSFG